MGVPLPIPPAPRTARLANISPLPIEPPRTPRTIRGDGRVLIPRAVPAARNVTGRRPASTDGPRRVRRVGTGQTPPVCRRQQEGHPAAADHTPRTDLLTNTCPSARRRAPPSGSGGGHGQGALRGAASAGRGRLGGVATPVTAIFRSSGRRQCPAASRLTRVSRGFSRAAPGRSPAPDQQATILAVTGAVRAGQTGFAGFPAPPRGGQPHTMRNDNTTECAHMAIRRKVLPRMRGGRRRRVRASGRAVSSGRGSRPGRASRTGGRTPGRARPRRGTCRRNPGQPGAGAARTRSSACRAG